MPDVAQHHAFGQRVLDRLPQEIRNVLSEPTYQFAQYGPDLWFMFEPWKRRNGRGRRMHTTKTGEFLMALARRTKSGTASRETFSYLAGFLCHYALDSTTHPYIIWQTTETWPTHRAHRDLEHALDAALLKREGVWGEKHPVTDYHFPGVQLPDSLSRDLDEVYQKVYGWTGTVSALNRCFLRYRWLYRQMEKPHSLLTLLSRIIPTHRLRSVPYVRSAFLDRDVENLSHQPWHQAYARDITSRESFPELVEKAETLAVRMISAAYRFCLEDALSEESLKTVFSNRSYLSGLDVEDPGNYAVKSLRPSE